MKDLKSRLGKAIGNHPNDDDFAPITEEAVTKTKEIIEFLEKKELTDLTFLYSTFDGGFQFEWDDPGVDIEPYEGWNLIKGLLELEILPNGSFETLTTEDML